MTEVEEKIYSFKPNEWKHFEETNGDGSDMLTMNLLEEKRHGFFVDVGSHHPFLHNNTYLMEKTFGWNGLSIEIDEYFYNLFCQERATTCINENAITFDFFKHFQENSFPTQIDYLNIDIDDNPRFANLQALIQIPLSRYRFTVINIEHGCLDDYTRKPMLDSQRTILNSFGYVLLQRKPADDIWVDGTFLDNSKYWDAFSMVGTS